MMSFQRSHAIFSIFLEICFLACWNDARGGLLSGDSGIFSANETQGGLAQFLINTRPNQLIAVQVFEFDSGYMLFGGNHRRTVANYYYKQGSEDIIHGRNDTSEIERVTLPFTFTSINQIEMNYLNLRPKDQGFVARYETYPNNLCTKSSLIEDITQLTCTRYSIAPTAANCSYVKDCPAHFVTWGYAKCDTETRVWHDTTTCIADPIRAKQCEFVDIGDYAVVTNCIYSLCDLRHYYKIMHNSDKWAKFKFFFGRGTVMDFLRRCTACQMKWKLVQHTLEKNCYYWRVRNFPLCVHCRFIFHCTSHTNTTLLHIGQTVALLGIKFDSN